MKLDIKALGITAAIFWSLSILFIGILNMMVPGYGQAVLEMVASIYPGYNATASVGQLLIGTGYGLVDGFIAGAVFAWIYNKLS